MDSNWLDHWPQHSDWHAKLSEHFAGQSFRSLVQFVDNERSEQTVYPPAADVFNAFRLTSLADTKVVILGQDPYHGAGQAHGLSFSVLEGVKVPPSLRNIFKELHEDVGCPVPECGNLTAWASQGVLLLNTVLTVRAGQANSHQKKGWERFTDHVVSVLNQRPDPVVFILWGKPAEKRSAAIDDRHPKIISPHPSPLSAHRGFFGSRPFSKANAFLIEAGKSPIDWGSLAGRRC